MIEALRLWLHVLGAAAWVGSQLFVFVVMVPILRSLGEYNPVRVRAVRVMTGRFGWYGWIALGAQVLTGTWLLLEVAPSAFMDLRYGWVLVVKLILVTDAILVTAYHTIVLGPRLLRIYGDGTAPLSSLEEEQARRLRRQSGVISGLNLLAALAVLFAGALLRSPWSYAPA